MEVSQKDRGEQPINIKRNWLSVGRDGDKLWEGRNKPTSVAPNVHGARGKRGVD